MTKKQRVRAEVAYIKRTIVLGAARTTALDLVKQKYELAEDHLRKWCLGVGGCDYWT